MDSSDIHGRDQELRRRIRALLLAFITGLVVSGATALALQTETAWLASFLPGHWTAIVHRGLTETYARYPFVAYGTDWLAFGHFVIAVAFIGPLRDPVRNVWVITFGIIACLLVPPYALLMGAVRDIPLGWRLIDCSFGIVGVLPLWTCLRWVREIKLT
ncbi:MAG: hypothetical protein LC772_10145 [Chloroflexi bacterium]|nr:hypothetical protein [Chloroflexota bacterium]